MSGSGPAESRRRRHRGEDKSEKPVSFLPQGNPSAKRAYICVIFGLIPGLGAVLGLPALVFGWLGYRAARRDPEGRGLGHSVVSMVLGILEVPLNVGGLLLIADGLGYL